MRGVSRRRLIGALSMSFLVLSLFGVPVTANPVLGYCPGSVHDQADPESCEALTGRVFPEAMDATDYISFWEFEAGMDYLMNEHDDAGIVTMFSVGESFGLENHLTGQTDTFPIYVIEVTNPASPIPIDERVDLLFMLSIHGNEKGGREGAMRIIEDFVKGIGMASETVHNGDGMPQSMQRPTGGDVTTYADYLDFMRLVFILPNPDGWVSDEFPYVVMNQCETFFCRGNGNEVDLNRQAPSVGWHRIDEEEGRLPMNEPEAQNYIPFLRDNYNFSYATDIHGMVNHENFVAIMMPAGQLNPVEHARAVRIADTLKTNLNEDSYFEHWQELIGPAADTLPREDLNEPLIMLQEEADPATSSAREEVCDLDLHWATCVGTATVPAAASGTFAQWMSVWDAIGYTDSGFHGDWFAQRSGLNAPAYDIELAYNHIVTDSQYQGAGQILNDYHVHAVRHIVKNFMDQGALDVQVTLQTQGTKTIYLRPSFVATNLDLERTSPGGPMETNPFTRDLVYSESRPYFASAGDYFKEMLAFIADGDDPGVMDRLDPSRITSDILEGYDNLVIAGSSIRDIEKDETALMTILEWVRGGGNLVLTDEALRFFDLTGLTDDSVEETKGYVGALEVDLSHSLAKGVRENSRQTYEPVPLGYTIEEHSAPMWGLEPSAWDELGGDLAGTLYNSEHAALGILEEGEGTIKIIGALLPDPSQDYYHPFGVEGYATIPTGNTVLQNALGWTLRYETTTLTITEDHRILLGETHPVAEERSAGAPLDERGAPMPFSPVLVVFAALLGLLHRRARRCE